MVVKIEEREAMLGISGIKSFCGFFIQGCAIVQPFGPVNQKFSIFIQRDGQVTDRHTSFIYCDLGTPGTIPPGTETHMGVIVAVIFKNYIDSPAYTVGVDIHTGESSPGRRAENRHNGGKNLNRRWKRIIVES